MYVPCRRAASAFVLKLRHLTFVLKLRNLLQKSWPSFFFDAFFSKNVQEGTFSPLKQDAKRIFEFEIRFFRLGFLTTEFIKKVFYTQLKNFMVPSWLWEKYPSISSTCRNFDGTAQHGRYACHVLARTNPTDCARPVFLEPEPSFRHRQRFQIFEKWRGVILRDIYGH